MEPNELKSGVIKSIQGKGDWEGKYGKMYQWDVEFEDGFSGECNTKTDVPWFKVGETVGYEVVSNNERWGPKIKMSNPVSSWGRYNYRNAPENKKPMNNSKQIIRGMCFKAAAMAWANQYKDKEFNMPQQVLVGGVMDLAKAYEKAFNEWMEE